MTVGRVEKSMPADRILAMAPNPTTFSTSLAENAAVRTVYD